MASDEVDLSVPKLDLGVSKLKGVDVTIVPTEHPDDRASRLARESRQAIIEDFKGLFVFIFILFGLAIIAGYAGYIGVVSDTASPEKQRWCQAVLVTIVSGGVNFVLGRNSKK